MLFFIQSLCTFSLTIQNTLLCIKQMSYPSLKIHCGSVGQIRSFFEGRYSCLQKIENAWPHRHKPTAYLPSTVQHVINLLDGSIYPASSCCQARTVRPGKVFPLPSQWSSPKKFHLLDIFLPPLTWDRHPNMVSVILCLIRFLKFCQCLSKSYYVKVGNY